MPGADYGPLSQGSRHDFRAISQITQPQDSRGEAPAHTPGRAEPPTQLPSGSKLLSPGGPWQALPEGQNETATHQHPLARGLGLHRSGPFLCLQPWEGDLSLLGARTLPTVLNLLITAGQRPVCRGLTSLLYSCAIGGLGPQLEIQEQRKETCVFGTGGGSSWRSLSVSLAHPL